MIWSLAGVYVLMVFCFFGRIQLAIAVNKVAATFVCLGDMQGARAVVPHVRFILSWYTELQ